MVGVRRRRSKLRLRVTRLREFDSERFNRQLPNEILLKIISYLDNPKDIKNCMLLSNEIRDSIFKKPQIMRNFQFNLDSMLEDWRHGSRFIQSRGRCIKKLQFGLFVGSRPLMKFILNQMPNLEELKFERKKWKANGEKKVFKCKEGDGSSDNEEMGGSFDQNERTAMKSEELDSTRNRKGEKGQKSCGYVGTSSEKVSNDSEITKKAEMSHKKPKNNVASDQSDDSEHSDPNNGDDIDQFSDELDSDDVDYTDSVHSSDDEVSTTIASDEENEIESESSNDEESESSEDEDINSYEEAAKLTKLKVLKIHLEDLDEFLENARDVKSLEKLSITLSEFNNEEILMNFINNQRNLKDLELIKPKRFKLLDLPAVQNPKINVQLNKLKVKLDCRNYEDLVNFLETQAECLEELELSTGLYRNPRTFRTFFEKIQNLKSLTLCEGLSKFIESLPNFELKSLKYFDLKNHSAKVDGLVRFFPNLETLKCYAIKSGRGTFDKISTLEVKILDLRSVDHLNFPNLKNFKVTRDINRCRTPLWISFSKNIRNVENISIQVYDREFQDGKYNVPRDLCILDNLNLQCFTKLKTFSYRHFKSATNPFDSKANPEDSKFVRVTINTDKKIVKLSQSLVENNHTTLMKLVQDFEEFTFYEIKFDDTKKCKIDTGSYIEFDESPAKRVKTS